MMRGVTPTPNPSPQGGGEFSVPSAWRKQSQISRDIKVSLPLVGRAKGWGSTAAQPSNL